MGETMTVNVYTPIFDENSTLDQDGGTIYAFNTAQALKLFQEGWYDVVGVEKLGTQEVEAWEIEDIL